MATNPSSHLPSGVIKRGWNILHLQLIFPFETSIQFGEMPRLLTLEAKSHRIFFDYPI